jgi:hypothetical protein
LSLAPLADEGTRRTDLAQRSSIQLTRTDRWRPEADIRVFQARSPHRPRIGGLLSLGCLGASAFLVPAAIVARLPA